MTATVIETETNQSVTLSQRLQEGSITFSEALRYASMLAEALRQIHDTGRMCGSLRPSGIVLTAAGLELVPASEPGGITPYTAPEILQGRAADSRSDIFAFGAIVYEMVTGQRAFTGVNADALVVSLTVSAPPPSGIPAVDHLVGNCIAKDPAVRCSRMQKVILELKLLCFATLGAEAPARQQVATAALRAETHQLEARMASLLESHEEAISDIQQTTRSALTELRGQVSALSTDLTAAQERSARAEQEHREQVSALGSDLAASQVRLERAEQVHGEHVSIWKSELAASQVRLERAEQVHGEHVSALRSELAAAQARSARREQDHREQAAILKAELVAAQERLERAQMEHAEQLSALRAELAAAQERSARAEQDHGQQFQHILAGVELVEGNLQAIDQRIAAGEGKIEFLSHGVTMLQEYEAVRMQEFEHALRSQSADIALVSASQVQTDDLVERVVAAMELLQTSVFDCAEA